MDYSYVPQMYQQGAQHNLDKQFQLAGQAQPVTQFLASLRQAKQMEIQQQIEEDRQRRLDIEQQRADQMAKYQNANSLLAAGQHFSAEISPGNVDNYRETFKGTPFSSLIPKDIVIPGGPVAAQDYGPDQGSVSLDGKDIPLTPGSTPAMSFTDIIKKPTGTNVKLRQQVEEDKNMRAANRDALKKSIADDVHEVQMLNYALKAETAPDKQKLLQARIDKVTAEAKTKQWAIDNGQLEAGLNLINARTNAQNAFAASASSQVPLNAARTGLAGAQTTLAETKAENADMSDSEKAAAADARAALKGPKKKGLSMGPPPAGPAAGKGKPLPTDLKAQYDSITNPAKKAVAKKRLVDNGFMVP